MNYNPVSEIITVNNFCILKKKTMKKVQNTHSILCTLITEEIQFCGNNKIIIVFHLLITI